MKTQIPVHPVHVRTHPLHARMTWLQRARPVQQKRSDHIRTTARRAQQVPGKIPQKIWRQSVRFQRNAETSILHGLARNVDVWPPMRASCA